MSPTGDPHNFAGYGPCWCGIDHGAEAYRQAFEEGRKSIIPPPVAETWTKAEARAVASQCGLPYGWMAHVKSDADKAVVRAVVARTSGGHSAEPLPCGHRSVQGTGRTPALAVARLAGWVRWHREDCAP